jgi:hypothetical protein
MVNEQPLGLETLKNPEVYAFMFDEKDFLFILAFLQSNPEMTDTRVVEYGVDFDNKFIDACTFEFKGQPIILVKQTAPLIDSLTHELKHVASGYFHIKS